MGRPLKTILDAFAAAGAERFAAAHQAPWLVWAQGRPSEQPIVAATLSGSPPRDAAPSPDPLVFEVVKGVASAFPFGVTLGRTENNDVVLRHGEVSRFHGFIHEKDQGFWLTDTNSRNGMWLDDVPLTAQKAVLLPEQGIVGLGALQLDYFSPARFVKYLQFLLTQPAGEPAGPGPCRGAPVTAALVRVLCLPLAFAAPPRAALDGLTHPTLQLLEDVGRSGFGAPPADPRGASSDDEGGLSRPLL